MVLIEPIETSSPIDTSVSYRSYLTYTDLLWYWELCPLLFLSYLSTPLGETTSLSRLSEKEKQIALAFETRKTERSSVQSWLVCENDP